MTARSMPAVALMPCACGLPCRPARPRRSAGPPRRATPQNAITGMFPKSPVAQEPDALSASKNTGHYANARALVASLLASLEPAEQSVSESPAERTRQRPDASPALDCEALVQCMPALFGHAMPLLRISGGQSEGSPAERAQPHLRRALRALYRLAWLREHDPRSATVLLAWYVSYGEEGRTERLLARLTAMVGTPAAQTPRRGPDAAAARRGGSLVLATAERAYAEAEELACDARWLSSDMEALRTALADARPLARVEVVGCGEIDARCPVYREGSTCVPVGDRCGGGESATWRLLRDAAEVA